MRGSTPACGGWRLLLALLLVVAAGARAQAATLVVATVNNAHMLELQALSSDFEQANPGLRIRWVMLAEPELRRAVSSDIQTHSGQFDVVTLGMYEAPLWAQRRWLAPIELGEPAAADGLLAPVRAGLSFEGTLYAAPLYGESSILFYRRDLLDRAGLDIARTPTWTEVAALAARLDDPARGVHGICLRATPGWGENVALLTTIANAFGGQWFDKQWRPQLQSPPWRKALALYVDLLRRHGPDDASRRGFNENLALFQAGHCALWVDASVAAPYLADPRLSAVAAEVGFAAAPGEVTRKGAHWLWAWALAVPAGIDPERRAVAQAFVRWATSRDYVERVAWRRGWAMVPSGTWRATYADPRYQRAAPWGELELSAILDARPADPTAPESPYQGIQFVLIPEFRSIGDPFGRLIADAVDGRLGIDEVLSRAQHIAERRLVQSGRLLPGPGMQNGDE